MTRVNVFLTAGNEHRSLRIGGKGKNDSAYARLNTDNGQASDVSIYVQADVLGERQYNGKPKRKSCRICGERYTDESVTICPNCETLRQGTDTRRSVFSVELPPAASGATVHINPHNHKMRQLANIGAMLCTIQGVQLTASPDPNDQQRGKKLLNEDIPDILAELEKSATLPDVVLPGGVSLAHALACVQIVDKLIADMPTKPAANPN